jgi:hypothetical protein
MGRRKDYLGNEIDLGLMITLVSERPQMYVGSTKLNCVAHFIEGFAFGDENFHTEIREFNQWLAIRLGFARNWAWWDGLKTKYPDSEDALRELPNLFEEFRNSR